MSKMSELHYEKMQEYKSVEDFEIEYNMIYAGRYGKFVPKIWNWFEKNYMIPQLMRYHKRPKNVKPKKVEVEF